MVSTLLLQALFLCPVCQDQSPASGTFPYCKLCRSLLRSCPPLCPQCAGVDCGLACRRPWRETDPGLIRSYSALWTFDTGGGPLLRAWKRRGGSRPTRLLLDWPPEFKVPAGVDTITYVPQSAARQRILGRSTSREVAHSLARHAGLQCQTLLETPAESSRHQAQRRLPSRLELTSPFAVREAVPASVILVDDFMTSGQTLRRAARALRSGGARDIHVVCLAARLAEGVGLERSLGESVSRAVTIGKERHSA